MRRALWALLGGAALAVYGQALGDLEALLRQVAAYEYGQSRAPLMAVTRLVEESLGSPARSRELEARLLRFIESKATAAGKDFAFRELSRIAGEASVPALSRAAARGETAEIALYALARIPGAAASEALREGAMRQTGAMRIGMIHALGQRRDSKAVALLRKLLSSREPGVFAAAAGALGLIGDAGSLEALASARTRTRPAGERRLLDEAYLQCAGRAAESNKAGAIQAYKELLAGEAAASVRAGALGGLARGAPGEAAAALSREIESGSGETRAIAIRLLAGLEGESITRKLVELFEKVGAPEQVVLLAALADRGDRAAAPLMASAAGGAEAEVRAAAFGGLGKLGDASHVKMLAEAAAGGQEAARTALHSLGGAGVDEAVAAALRQAAGRVKVELMVAAGERGIAAATESLIGVVQDRDAEGRREAMQALRNVAGPDQVPALVSLVTQAGTAGDRREATQTLGSVLKRSGAGQVSAVVSAYRSAGARPVQLALLEAIGQSSHEEALPALREALRDPSPEVARAATLALSEWTTPEPMADLLEIARKPASPVLQVLGLRGYLKLLALPSQRTPAESARLLGEAMGLAKQAAEKRTILSLLPSFPGREALEVAKGAAADPDVAKEAAAAIERINGLIKFQ